MIPEEAFGAADHGGAPVILVVDDDPFFRRLLTELLESQGYGVLHASSGAEIPEIVTRRYISLVLTDIVMPGDSGLAVLKKVKRLRPGIPVIIISSHQDFGTARDVLRNGALDYLVKPLDSEELFETVRRGLKVHRSFIQAAVTEREAQRRLSDLVLLKEIGETASTDENLQRLFDKILDSIRLSADVEIASLMLLEEDGALHIRAARGLSEEIVEHTSVRPGEGVSGHVLLTGEAVLVDDITRDSRFPTSEGEQRYKTLSLLSVPIRSRDRIIGVLNVNNKRSGEKFSAEDQNLLAAIAHQAALAIENFKLVSNLRRQAQELERANLDLRKLHQARSRLICSLSHELNTPLTSILGYLEYILNYSEWGKVEELQDHLGKVQLASLQMEKLISGMLRLFSFDSGEEPWEWKKFPLAEVVREALEGQQEQIVAKNVVVEMTLTEDLVKGDREKLLLALEALLDNAVKFNRPGGRLTIHAKRRSSKGSSDLYLQIHNDGRSIPEEAREDVFDQYTQLGDLNTDKPSGVGIGLAICRSVLDRMQAQIRLEPPGIEGTTFGLFFPLDDHGA